MQKPAPGSGAGFVGRGSDPGTVMAGNNHPMSSGAFGAPDDRAKITRVLDSVTNNDKRILAMIGGK